jgi:AcrR family transcriptional regulator
MSSTVVGDSQVQHRLTPPGRQTRDRIVHTAADLMYLQGVAGTSIPDIQNAAQVSASQIYHYFGDKQGLIRAVIAHQIEATLNGQRAMLEQLDSFEALRAWCDAFAARLESQGCEGGCEIGSLASELAESDDTTRADLVAAFDRWEAPFRDGLVRMQHRGELHADVDAAALATAMMAAVQGGALLSQLRRSSDPLRQATAAAIGYIESFAVRSPPDGTGDGKPPHRKPNPRSRLAAPALSKKQPRRDAPLGDARRKQKPRA